MSSPLRAAAVVAALLGVLLLPASSPVAADGGPSNLSFYGDAIRGWGLDSTNVTSPGPTITVTLGYPVTLALHGLDTVLHNWFIDYNRDNASSSGEPTSQNFQGAGPFSFTFTPDREGNWTYKCSFHFGNMFGTIRVVPQTNVTLHGEFSRGWGLSNATIGTPGPSLVFLVGTNVTFVLIANDTSITHDFFIDYDRTGAPSAGEPKAPDFSGGNPVTFKIHLDRAGNFTFYCEYHPGAMHGNILILGPVLAGGGFNVALIPGILLISLAGVLVFAAVYHVRAVRAAKRHR